MNPDRLRGVFYCIQFERDLTSAIDWVLRLSEAGRLGMTNEELSQTIDAALGDDEPIARFDLSEFGHTEVELRAFLAGLRSRLRGRNA